MWKYGDAVSRDDAEKVMQFTESLFEKYGAVPTELNSENRKQFNQRVTYFYKGWYYRIDLICFDEKPYIVFESTDDARLASVGVMEDGDSFPYGLTPEQIEQEVRYLFEIDPYPEYYPEW